MTRWRYRIVCHESDCDGPQARPGMFSRAVQVKGTHVQRTRHDREVKRVRA